VDPLLEKLHTEPQLTQREKQVLILLAAGKSSKVVARDLGISFKTAVTHRAHILEKLDVHETVSAMRWAIRTGLIDP
jgi:DNA-binding NarL/FixJ family response regulator